jgi:hypothetical protein
MPLRLNRARAKTRRPMTTESQSSLRFSFETAVVAESTTISDTFVPAATRVAARL